MSTGTQTEVVMPQMGVSVSEGTITKWLKQPGEAIARDEPLLEISTDKVDTEVPSPADGVLAEIVVPEGETVEVGTVLARIGPEGSAAAEPAAAAPEAPAQTEAPAPTEEPAAAPAAEPESAAQLAPAEPAPAQPAPPAQQAPAPPAPAAPAVSKVETPRPAVPAPTPPDASVGEPSGTGFVVQVAAVRGRGEADTIARRLSTKGYPAFVTTVPGGVQMFRVRVGKFTDRREAEAIAGRLEREEQFKPWITR